MKDKFSTLRMQRLQKRESEFDNLSRFIEDDTFNVFIKRFPYGESITRKIVSQQIDELDIEQRVKEFFETPCPNVVEYFREKFSTIEQTNRDDFLLTAFFENTETEYLKLYVYFNFDNSCKTIISYQ